MKNRVVACLAATLTMTGFLVAAGGEFQVGLTRAPAQPYQGYPATEYQGRWVRGLWRISTPLESVSTVLGFSAGDFNGDAMVHSPGPWSGIVETHSYSPAGFVGLVGGVQRQWGAWYGSLILDLRWSPPRGGGSTGGGDTRSVEGGANGWVGLEVGRTFQTSGPVLTLALRVAGTEPIKLYPRREYGLVAGIRF